MPSAIDKAFESYEDNGGRVAITGFNFQAYCGIFHMLYLHKNDKTFKISFEVEDDLVIENLTDNTKIKIQVKSANLTRGKLIEKDKNDRSMLGKILITDNFDFYALSFPSETSKGLVKIGKPIETLIGGDTFEYNIEHEGTPGEKKDCKVINDLLSEDCFKDKTLVFIEMPFNKVSDNCFRYILGYANDGENNEKVLALSREQLSALLGTIYNESAKSVIPKALGNEIIKKLEKAEDDEKLMEEYIEKLYQSKTPTYKKKLLAARGNYQKESKYYNKILSGIEIPPFDDERNFTEYFDECLGNFERELSTTHRETIDKYKRAWFVIEKVVKGESGYEY